mmetsp:Transcript_22633/g.59817  ORF Transcript_22633/g.59817 Transcript_22633/m.59817 type:complete len:207 (+) Transcript_22633:1781-2401(+)
MCSSSKFWPLRSLWTMPFAWMYTRASKLCLITVASQASGHVSPRCRPCCTALRTSPPSQCSITMFTVSPSSYHEKIRRMCGWSKFCSNSASILRRLSSQPSGRTTVFMTRDCPVRRSVTRCTMPYAPWPRSSCGSRSAKSTLALVPVTTELRKVLGPRMSVAVVLVSFDLCNIFAYRSAGRPTTGSRRHRAQGRRSMLASGRGGAD